MAERDTFHKFNSVEEVNNFFGATTHHPLVGVIDLNTLEKVNHIPKQFGIYSIACYWDDNSTTSTHSDIEQCALLAFYAPGYYGKHTTGTAHNPKGYILVFNKDLLRDTLLQNRIEEYPFFSNQNDNIIPLHAPERDMIYNCMLSINEEIHHPEDKYTSHILASGIAVLLNICMRFYERQIQKPKNMAMNIILRLNNILDRYIHTPAGINKEVPTVASCASELGISANYLGDVVRNSTKISAHRYIHRTIVNEAKRLLEYTNMSIGQIAYHLGFKYPHHLTRIFKNDTGSTPGQYRGKRDKSIIPSTTK